MTAGRRPLAVRGTGWARATARWLTGRGISPDAISKASLVFAAIAGASLWLAGSADGLGAGLAFLLAACCVQGRLLCNLFDGMVAVEGGRGGPEGPYWNEVPDRPADVMILAGAGLACGSLALGLACGVAALGTAYLRAFGTGLGRTEDFAGPFAKPQRMAVVTGLAATSAIEAALTGTRWIMWAGLWVLLLGTLLTCVLRARRLRQNLS